MSKLYCFNPHRWVIVFMLLFLATGITLYYPENAHADCVFDTLTDIPLDAKIGSAPGIIMFLIDDSGSMEWTLSLDGVDYASNNGTFDTNGDGYRDFNYVFNPDSGYEMYWKTQWSEVNRLYYNPSSTYTPWPGKENADPDNPANPIFTGDNISLGNVYHDFSMIDDSDIENAAGTVIVDDRNIAESRYIIVDDGDAGYVLEDANSIDLHDDYPHGNNPRTTNNSTYNSDYDRVYDSWIDSDSQNDLPLTATYSFNLEHSGNYDVYVRWREWNNRSNQVKIKVNGTLAATVDQEESPRQAAGTDHVFENIYWYYVGNYNFNKDGDGAVIQFFHDGNNDSFSSDAVLLNPTFADPNLLDAVFATTTTADWDDYDKDDCYDGDNDGNGDCLLAQDEGTYTATWTSNTLDPTKTYNIYARWDDSNERGTSVTYQAKKDDGTTLATTSVNQRNLGGKWNLLAENINFASSTGAVHLAHEITADEIKLDEACADAIAFVPSDQSTASDIIISNFHYYVKGSNNQIYLVNSRNNDFEYYLVDHNLGSDTNASVNPGDDDDKIVDGELVKISASAAASVGIITDRTFAEDQQNFANWFAFYRKRQYTAKNAMARVIDDMAGVRIGILGINNTISQRALPVDVDYDGNHYDRTSTLLTALYEHNPNGGTPLRNGLVSIGEYFKGNHSLNNNEEDNENDFGAYISTDSKPFFRETEGGSCEQAFCILMTDGYYNGSDPFSNDNKDGDNNTDFDGGKFADDKDDTLADVAMHYYENDLNSNLSNSVPATAIDTATHQHMVTFSVSFGVSGAIERAAYPNCTIGGDCPDEWWIGSGGDALIDDLFHAAVNGRGDYINAGTPEELSAAMDELQYQISSRLGSAAAAGTNSIQVRTGTKIYQGIYHTNGWKGDLKQFRIDKDDDGKLQLVVDWTAAAKLDAREYSDRVIYSYDGTTGIEFSADESAIPYSEELVDYIKGDSTNNTENGGSYRVRKSKLGDIVHSEPIVFDNKIFVGANDGMLHVFAAGEDEDGGGEELFAYIPKIIIDGGTLDSGTENYAAADYSHKFYVDGMINIRKIATNTTLLVGGLRKGGRGYFCLDIDSSNFSDPPTIGDVGNVVKWEYSDVTDEDLGYSYSKPYIVKTNDANVGWVVIFSNGYDSTTEHAVLYMIDINDSTGEIVVDNNSNGFSDGVKKFDVGSGPCNGLAMPALTDVNFDGKVDYVYAGDLTGNLWKFDIASVNSSDWGSAYHDGTNPQPLIKVENGQGGQPITAQPDVMEMSCSTGQKGYLVIFGTGRYLGVFDPINDDQQTFYGIWDWQDEFISPVPTVFPHAQTATSKSRYYGVFNADSADPSDDTSDLTNAPASADALTLISQGVDQAIDGYRILTDEFDHGVPWFDPTSGDDDDDTDFVGWYFNLEDSGGRVIQDPAIRPGFGGDIGVAAFISNVPATTSCGGNAGNSWFYQVNVCNGGMTSKSYFDTNGDDVVNTEDTLDDKLASGMHFDEMLYRPVQVGDRLYVNDSSGGVPKSVVIPDNMEGIFYWQQVY